MSMFCGSIYRRLAIHIYDYVVGMGCSRVFLIMKIRTSNKPIKYYVFHFKIRSFNISIDSAMSLVTVTPSFGMLVMLRVGFWYFLTLRSRGKCWNWFHGNKPWEKKRGLSTTPFHVGAWLGHPKPWLGFGPISLALHIKKEGVPHLWASDVPW
jgi:uncharacterized membrane protein